MERKFIETELGRIPSDWIVTTIKDAGIAITDGINPQKYRESEFCEYSMPAYDCGMSPNICKGSSMNSNRTKISGEVLLFNKLNVRQRRVWYVENAPANSVCSMEFLAYKSNVICLPLLREILLQDKVTNDFISVSRGTSNSQKRIAPSDFWNFKVAVPADIKEQQRIASCLSAMNDMILKLSDVIEKKRRIKEGLMLQLLTGKKRLPGFSGDWKEMTLGECAMIKARIGWQGLTTAEYLDSGNYFLITGTEIENGKVSWNRCHYVSKERFLQDKNIQICQGDVLITKDGTIGKVAYLDTIPGDGTLNSGVFVVRSKDNSLLQEYMAYVFLSRYFNDFIDKIVAGSTITHLYQKDIINFAFPIPPSIEEQKAISKIITAVDNEIQTIEYKRNKYVDLKQGMRQQLLTGKTRL